MNDEIVANNEDKLEEKLLAIEHDLDTNLAALALFRQQEAKEKRAVEYWEADLQTYIAAFPNAVQLATAKELHANQVQDTELVKISVKDTALKLYSLNNNKSVYTDVKVAQYTTFEIDDEQAIDWAAEHHHKGLKLNLAEIKKVAKAGMEVDGVVMGTENRVRIASDLSGYLTDAE